MARMHPPTVLVVDDEALFRESVLDAASATHPEWRLLAASNGREALERLAETAVDVIVTDLRMPELDGLGLLAALSQLEPRPRVIVVSAFATDSIQDDLRQLGAIRCIDKPVDLPSLIAGIAVLQANPASSVTGVSVSGFAQLLELERKTCQLRLEHEGRSADLLFDDGRLVDAIYGGLEGHEAAYEALSWENARMEILPLFGSPRARVTSPLRHLILESAQRNDEGAFEEMLFGETEDYFPNAVSPPSGVVANDRFKRALDAVMDLDGALGVVLVDASSGSSIYKVGGGPGLDLDRAAVGNSKMVGAKRETITSLGLDDTLEEILITLPEQYHLLHWVSNEPSQFLYFVLDREGANLAVARQRLASAAGKLKG